MVVSHSKEIFRDGLKILSEIDQVEKKLLRKMFKNTGQSMKLKAPVLPDSLPIPPTEEEVSKGKVADENTWV